MTVDELMIAGGDVVPIGGGEYVCEMRKLGGTPIAMRVMASPMRAEWPVGVEPRGFDCTLRIERFLNLGQHT